MDKEELFELGDIQIDSDTLEEDEERALENLPINVDGKNKLISYLESIETSNKDVYAFLFDNYSCFMTEEEYFYWRKVAVEICPILEDYIDEDRY